MGSILILQHFEPGGHQLACERGGWWVQQQASGSSVTDRSNWATVHCCWSSISKCGQVQKSMCWWSHRDWDGRWSEKKGRQEQRPTTILLVEPPPAQLLLQPPQQPTHSLLAKEASVSNQRAQLWDWSVFRRRKWNKVGGSLAQPKTELSSEWSPAPAGVGTRPTPGGHYRPTPNSALRTLPPRRSVPARPNTQWALPIHLRSKNCRFWSGGLQSAKQGHITDPHCSYTPKLSCSTLLLSFCFCFIAAVFCCVCLLVAVV